MNSTFISCTKALSDPTRVRAFAALKRGELCVCRIISLLGLAPSTISKHMTILRQAGLVVSRKEGKWMHYRLPDKWPDKTVGRIAVQCLDILKNDKGVRTDARQLDKICKIGLVALCRKQRP
jgi:ArsR family transcriptional regulator, arsenate/arsenite/antimonite-responsive transcriptional repressor